MSVFTKMVEDRVVSINWLMSKLLGARSLFDPFELAQVCQQAKTHNI